MTPKQTDALEVKVIKNLERLVFDHQTSLWCDVAVMYPPKREGSKQLTPGRVEGYVTPLLAPSFTLSYESYEHIPFSKRSIPILMIGDRAYDVEPHDPKREISCEYKEFSSKKELDEYLSKYLKERNREN